MPYRRVEPAGEQRRRGGVGGAPVTQQVPSTEPELTGVRNFRDVGGLPTVDGRRVRQGVLFRSGHLAHATGEDAAFLASLGLHTIFDFRNAADQKLEGPDVDLPGVRNVNLPLSDPADGAEPERHPFPDAVVVADGEYTGLHRLVADGAVVVLRLSTGCGSCARVIERLDEFTDALGPVRLRVLMPQHAPGADGAIRRGAVDASLVLADPAGAASQALGLHSFPTAVLLGTDRLTAGGPVGGADDVLAFLEEIREIMTTELPAATDGSTATPEVRA